MPPFAVIKISMYSYKGDLNFDINLIAVVIKPIYPRILEEVQDVNAGEG
jgi:hypothetical protein